MSRTGETNHANSTASPAMLDDRSPRDGAGGPRRGRGRALIVGILVIGLVASGLAREAAQSVQQRAAPMAALGGSGSSLSSMNSFALALLLGGLRGPLVMALWSKAEAMKNERDLEDFDTLVEWIRLLQPEFDTVHLFQMWNKAYNVSVQMASVRNKYSTILDALDYGRSVLNQRSNNISVLAEIGRIYSDKLGQSQEKLQYRHWVRTETLPVIRVQFPAERIPQYKEALARAGLSESAGRLQVRTADGTATAVLNLLDGRDLRSQFGEEGITYETLPRQDLRRAEGRGRRTSLDTMLDARGYVLDQYRDELRYLVPFEPFPHGLSPIGLGYAYYMRAIELQTRYNQRHIQMAPIILDARAPILLKLWDEEEWDRGRRFETAGLGLAVPADQGLADVATAKVAPTAPIANRRAIEDAILCYDRAIELIGAARKEYDRHIEEYVEHLAQYLSHYDHQEMVKTMLEADRYYLQAMLVTGTSAEAREGRRSLLKLARDRYDEALKWNQLILLKHYVAPHLLKQVLQSMGYAREDLEASSKRPVPKDQYGTILARTRQLMQQNRDDVYFSDRREYERFMYRIESRLDQLGAPAPAAPLGPGPMTF